MRTGDDRLPILCGNCKAQVGWWVSDAPPFTAERIVADQATDMDGQSLKHRLECWNPECVEFGRRCWAVRTNERGDLV